MWVWTYMGVDVHGCGRIWVWTERCRIQKEDEREHQTSHYRTCSYHGYARFFRPSTSAHTRMVRSVLQLKMCRPYTKIPVTVPV